MINFIMLIMKNLGRNKVRTMLTSMAVIVLVMICAIVTNITESVRRTVDAEASQTKLIVEERWVVPSRVPVRYIPEIARIPGVVAYPSTGMYSVCSSRTPSRS